jgi:hypothetical protein
MSKIIETIEKATGVSPKDGKSRQDYLTRLVYAVSEMEDADWEKLPEDVHDWCTEAVTAVKDKRAIPDPEPPTEAPAPAPSSASTPPK